GRGGFDCAVRDEEGTVVLRVDGYRTAPLPNPPPADVVAPMRSVMGPSGDRKRGEAGRSGSPPSP
ncbi:MAG: hypothetical protein JO045_03705, partial [Mycobacterium sp.]|nr:hypothetical protein [Mycobacterium sp.]